MTKTNNTLAITFFLLCLFIMGLVVAGNAQQVKQDAQGNYYAVKATKDTSITYKPTGKTFTTSKGETFPVYVSKNGKLFVIRTSKATGNQYKTIFEIIRTVRAEV